MPTDGSPVAMLPGQTCRSRASCVVSLFRVFRVLLSLAFIPTSSVCHLFLTSKSEIIELRPTTLYSTKPDTRVETATLVRKHHRSGDFVKIQHVCRQDSAKSIQPSE